MARCCRLPPPFAAVLVAAISIAIQPAGHGQTAGTSFTFDFGTRTPRTGRLQVSPTTIYTKARGYGLDSSIAANNSPERPGPEDASSLCTYDRPFLFAVDLPEGNYNVTVTLGDLTGPSLTTLKAEARRLVLEKVQTKSGELATRTFTINVRNSRLQSGETVRLKPDEQGHADWDDRLSLEFNDTRPCVSSLDIKKVDDAITVYLAGDSTVTDQAREPWCAWGQMLPRFFAPGVAIANHAESGEAMKSFIRERRLEKILDTIKAGDYLFIQFAHNDQKPGSAYLEPFTSYKDHLRIYIDEARKRGAVPVLVTSMHRRFFDENGKVQNTLGDYPEAMRQVASEAHVALIDLNAMSKLFYEALGPADSVKAFVHYPAGSFPGQTADLKDDSHFNAYGAYELARCIVSGIRANGLGIAKFLVNDVPQFDPAHPDPVAGWSLPRSPVITTQAPQGR